MKLFDLFEGNEQAYNWHSEPEQRSMDATRQARLNREREPEGSEAIDARLRAQNDQLAQYAQSGNFWLKQKDTQEHISDVFVGKAAANAAAVELLKQRPELRGNLVITAWGPSEQQGVAEGILGSDPNRGQKVPDWAKRGVVGKIGRKLDSAWSNVQSTVPQHLLSKQSSVPATNAPATKEIPNASSVIPARAIPQSAMTKPSQSVTKNVVKTIADKEGVAEGLEQVYKVLAVDKSNALSKQVKLKVKASSLDEVFERLAINDWYPLEINGVEVINGKRLKQGVAEGTGNIGAQIKALYQKISNQGDDAIEFMYYDSPIFAQYWDEYEGDLDSIIAEVDPSELQVIQAELQSAAEDQGLAEAPGAETLSHNQSTVSSNLNNLDLGEGHNPYGYEVGQSVKLSNGKQGRVIDIFDDSIEVMLPGGQTVTVDFRDAEVLGEQGVAAPTTTGRGVDAKGRTQSEWMQLVKSKFPTAKIQQTRMIDGPATAILPDGRKLSWNKVEQTVSETGAQAAKFDPKTGLPVGQQLSEFGGDATQFSTPTQSTPVTQQPPRRGYSIILTGKPGRDWMAEYAWEALEKVLPRDYPGDSRAANVSGSNLPVTRAMLKVQQAHNGPVMVKTGIASEDIAETLVSKLVANRVPADFWRITSEDLDEGDISQLEKDIAAAPVAPIANMEAQEKIGGRHDADDFDAMVNRLKKLAGSGPMKTVWDPVRRVYKNMPTAQQPKK